MAKTGNKQACTILAKQLIQLKKQQTKTISASSKITGVKCHSQVMASNLKLSETIKTTTKTMEEMNRIQNPLKIAQIMKEFEKQNIKLGMTDEMINETLESVLEESDDESESDKIVNKVLDEIGIEISGKMINAPNPENNKFTAKETENEDVDEKEIQAIIAKLKV